MTNKYFKLHSSCAIVKGFSIGNIYDLRRGNLYPIPNSILDLLEYYSDKKVSILLNDYKDQLEIINKYLNFLIENELIFFTNDLEHFPLINKNYRKPFILDIVLMEIDNFDFEKKAFFENDIISEIGCTELVLISKDNSVENLESILLMLDKSKVQTVTYLTDYKDYSHEISNNLFTNHLRLREIFVYNCLEEQTTNQNSNSIFTNETLETLLTRRVSSVNDLVPNLDAFIEAQKYNLFYNRRIYIDNENYIKHSIDDKEVFGNIENQNIIDIVLSSRFQNLWNISKDMITSCKDCELRYICPDNRIPVLDNETGEYYNTEDCNYSPYTNQWK
jgi:SPASM domain peptide maturase of grasp-with-spasm system